MGKNNRYRYLTESKTRKKLYKAKKLWLVAGLSTMAFGGYQLAAQPNIHANADTITSSAASTATQSAASSSAVSDNDQSLTDAPTSNTTTSSAAPTSAPAQSSQTQQTQVSQAPQTSTNDTSSSTTQTNQTTTNTNSANTTQSSTNTETTANANTTVQSTTPSSNASVTENAPSNTTSAVPSANSVDSNQTTSASTGPQTSETANTSAQAVYDSPNTNVSATSSNTSATKSIATPNADVQTSSSSNVSLRMNADDTTSASNLNSTANYALSNQSQTTSSASQTNSQTTGGNGDGSGSSNQSSSSSMATPSADANTQLASQVYSNPQLDEQIRMANMSMDQLLRSQNNDISEPELRDMASGIYLSSNAPTLPTTTQAAIAQNGSYGYGLGTDNTLVHTAKITVTGNNTAASFIPGDVAITFQGNTANYSNANAALANVSTNMFPVQPTTSAGAGMQTISLQINQPGGNTMSIVPNSNLGNYIENLQQNEGNATYLSPTFGVMSYDQYAQQNAGSVDPTTGQSFVNPKNTSLDAQDGSGLIGYEKINIGKMLQDQRANEITNLQQQYQNSHPNDTNPANAYIYAEQNATTPINLAPGSTITVQIKQNVNTSYNPNSTNGNGSYDSTNANSSTTNIKGLNVSTIANSANNATAPILIHYLDKNGNDIQAPQYVNTDGYSNLTPNTTLNYNIASPTGWIYKSYTSDIKGTSNGQTTVDNDKKDQSVAINASNGNTTLNAHLWQYDINEYSNITNNVYLTYAQDQPIAVNPSNPQSPNTPTDPTDPNGPKYGNDVNNNNLAKTVTSTVQYYDRTTNTKIPSNIVSDNNQSIQYGRTLVVDQGTGQELGWSSTDNARNVDIPLANGDQAWHTWPSGTSNQTAQVTSPDLSSSNYIKPSTNAVAPITTTANGGPYNTVVTYEHAYGVVHPGDSDLHGVDPSQLSKTITQNIDYQDATNGNTVAPTTSRSTTYTRNAVYDKVTGQLKGYTAGNDPYGTVSDASDTSTWTTPNASLTSVTSPDLSSQGYTAPDQPVVPTYMTTYQTASQLPDIIVKYNHQINNVPQTSSTSRTINYVDGTNGNTVSTPVTQSTTITRNQQVDAVTKQVVGYSPWGQANTPMNSVGSPDLSSQGYTAPDQATVPGVDNGTIAQAAQNNSPLPTVTVKYYHQIKDVPQNSNTSRTIYYVDGTNGNTVAQPNVQNVQVTRQQHTDAVTGQIVGYSNWTQSGDQIHAVNSPDLTNLGYTAPDQAVVAGVNPDAAANAAQNGTTLPAVTVKYYHQTATKDVDQKTVSRTIHYLDSTNNQTVAPDYTDHADFKKVAVYDKVNGNLLGYSSNGQNHPDISTQDSDKAWIPATQALNDIPSPDLTDKGYTQPNPKDGAPAITIDPNTQNMDLKVYYGHQHVYVGPDNPYKVGQLINPNDPNGPRYGDNITNDYLKKDIVRTINYVDKDSGQQIAPSVTQDVTYHRMVVIDKVTGQASGFSLGDTRKIDLAADDGENAWQTDDDQWAKQTSPDMTAKGYNKQYENALQKSVKLTDSNVTMTIPYTHQITPADYTDNYQVGSPINPNDPNGAKWPAGTDKNSLYRQVTRTIHYLDGKTGTKLAPDKVETVNFYRTAMVDKVTGKFLGYALHHDSKVDIATADADKAWQSDDPNWHSSINPLIDGYNQPNPGQIDNQKVAYDQANGDVNVYYLKPAANKVPNKPKQEPKAPALSAAASNYYKTDHVNNVIVDPTSSAPAQPQTPAPNPQYPLDNKPTHKAKPAPKAPANPTKPNVPQKVVNQTPQQPSAHSAAPVSQAQSAAPSTAAAPVQSASQAPASQAPQSQAELPQTGNDATAQLEAEIMGGLILAFAALLKRMPRKKNEK